MSQDTRSCPLSLSREKVNLTYRFPLERAFLPDVEWVPAGVMQSSSTTALPEFVSVNALTPPLLRTEGQGW
jgi:hypothetical protein